MKKILLLLNGLEDPLSNVNDLIEVAKQDKSSVHVLFLHRLYIPVDLQYPLTSELPLTETVQAEEREQLRENIRLTGETLAASGIPYSLSEEDLSLSDLLNQSAYSDMIFTDGRMDFSDLRFFPMSTSIKDILADAHCPVFLRGRESSQVKKIILAYDGSYSSIYAVKLFSYLFPYWRTLPGYLVNIQSSGAKHHDVQDHIKKWLSLHFDHLQVDMIHGKAAEELPEFINRHDEGVITVMGAYGRNAISRLFRQSLAGIVLKKTGSALFITHE